jgi:nitroreductase
MVKTENKIAVKINETLQLIYKRRSVRKYKDKAVEEDKIIAIIDAGRMAPSAINRQPWKFYILTKMDDIEAFENETAKAATKGILSSGLKNIMKSLADGFRLLHGIDFMKAKNPIFHGAPVVVFITSPKDNEWAALDIGMCSQNMMLAAKSIGLDSCPVGLGKYVEQTDLYSKLNVSKSDHVNLALIFGYSDETPEVHERKKDNVFYI